MKRILLIHLLGLFCGFCFGQAPSGYYESSFGKKGYELQVALHQIIMDHEEQTYRSLWTHFYTTDAKPDGKVWDIYSDNPGGTPPYEFVFGDDQCGNYSGEGDCYNREHSVPKSWFNDQYPMYTDLFHMYPTDGYVNNRRANYPLGEVTNASWTSRNGSKVGSNSTSGYSGIVFEPIDEYKGDMARSYFYMSTRYMDKNLGREPQSMFQGYRLKEWAVALLLQWHEEDPVSRKETDRNNAVYRIQKNRNPFIDYPVLAGMIFGRDSVHFFNPLSVPEYDDFQVEIYPNPVESQLHISSVHPDIESVDIVDVRGRIIWSRNHIHADNLRIDMSGFPSGLYLIRLESPRQVEVRKIIKK